MKREITFENMKEEYFEKYSQFISDQIEKYDDYVKDATDYLINKVKGKTFDIQVDVWLDETPSNDDVSKQFVLKIGFEGEYKLHFTLYEKVRDEEICSLVLSDYDCFTIDDEHDRFQNYMKKQEDLKKEESKKDSEIMEKAISGEISSEDPRWKELAKSGSEHITNTLPHIITHKGVERAKKIFVKYLSNEKLKQKEAVELYCMYPLYLFSKKEALQAIHSIRQFVELKQKYDFNDELIEKHLDRLKLTGYLEDNPEYEEPES